MGTEALSTRMPVVAELITVLENDQNALVTGPSGSGKSHVLRDLAAALRATGHRAVEFDCADRAARQALRDEIHAPQIDPAFFLLDNFEQADTSTLHALLDLDERGRRAVAALETGNQRTPYLRAVDEVLRDREPAAPRIAAVRQFPLRPLAFHDIAWLVHELSPTMLNSATVHTIASLAAGRPAWALDLLVLAEHGALTHLPRPGIVEQIPRELNLPGMRAVVRSAGPLTPASATAALLSAELGPTDYALLEDHLGARAVRELGERGVLTRAPESDHYAVLPFVAAALRPFAAPELLSEGRRAIAEYLVAQEAIGIPLSTSETLRCARGLAFSDDDRAPLPHREARVRVLHRATTSSVAMRHDSQARAFLLRTGAANAPLPGTAHAQVVGALVGAGAALDLLDAHGGDAPRDATRRSALRAAAAAEAGGALTTAARTDDTAEPTETERVTAWWNSNEPLGAVHSTLRHLSDTAEPETAALAAALFELDSVWNGRLPRGTWIASGARIPALPVSPAGSDDLVAGTLLLARGVTVFLAGELALRADELIAASTASATPEAHARWIRHLVAAGEALACGHAERAALEWCLLEDTAPRATALRLRECLRTIGDSITAASAAETSAAAPGGRPLTLEHFTRYLTGHHSSLRQAETTDDPESETLPVLRFARAHLTAAAQQNPVELVRAAQRLQRLELWAPAAFAASTARTIYLSRRTVSGVRECDDRLDALEAHLAGSLPWYRTGTLPTAHFARLTPRELEVARLAAKGMSNAALALRLGCSVRTIESHLAQAKAKLGAHSRQELAAKLWAEAPQPGPVVPPRPGGLTAVPAEAV